MLETINPQELKIIKWLRDNDLTNNLSDFIERNDAYTRIVSGIMGWQWEDEFKTMCELHGLTHSPALLNSRFDVLVNNKYRVQCKFSVDKTKIDIRNKDKTMNRRYKNDDFDFMAIKTPSNIYIVPIQFLLEDCLTKTRQSVKIESISEFKNNFDAFKD